MATLNLAQLKVLRNADALALLRELAPEVVETHPEACLVLVQELEGWPLALQVAGQRLHTEASARFGATHLIAELCQVATLLATRAPADRADLANDTTPTIAALHYKSREHLDEFTHDCYAYLGYSLPNRRLSISQQ